MSGRSVLDEAIAGSGRLDDLHHELESLQLAMTDAARADDMDLILARFGERQHGPHLETHMSRQEDRTAGDGTYDSVRRPEDQAAHQIDARQFNARDRWHAPRRDVGL
jgi:hypothetical protein